MQTVIHPTASVSADAELGIGVSIGPYTIIGPGVQIGDRTQIASSVCIEGPTQIGSDCRITHGAVLGTDPQDMKYDGEESRLMLGQRNVIREYVTINRGTQARGVTTIGDDNFIMAYTHIAHDCDIRNHVIISNATNMAGHVQIDDYAMIGGMVAIHQFVHIGAHCMVGGGSLVSKDVCPYIKVARYPLKPWGLNVVGLRRRGFSTRTLSELKQAYRLLFRSHLNITQAVARIEVELPQTEEITTLLSFIHDSARRSKKRGKGLVS